MTDLASQLAGVEAHPAHEHAFMTVAGDVRAVDVGDARGPAYVFTDDISCGGVIAPGTLDHEPAPGEMLRLTGGWVQDGAFPGSRFYTFLGIAAETVH